MVMKVVDKTAVCKIDEMNGQLTTILWYKQNQALTASHSPVESFVS